MEKKRVVVRRRRRRASSSSLHSGSRRRREGWGLGGPALMIAVAFGAIAFGIATFGSAFSNRGQPSLGEKGPQRMTSPSGLPTTGAPTSPAYSPNRLEESQSDPVPSNTAYDVDLDTATTRPEISLDEPVTSTDWFATQPPSDPNY